MRAVKSFAEYAKHRRSWPGRGGVDVYPKCYRGRFEYCGWQVVGGVGDIAPFSAGRINVQPNVVAHFDPRSIYMFGIDPQSPSTNLRFTVGAITVGGQPQWANNSIPDGAGTGDSELLSDVFNRSDQPLLVYNWALFSTDALGSPLVFDLFNLNATTIRIYVALFGNAMDDCFIGAWKEASYQQKSITVEQIKPVDTPDAWRIVELENDEPKKSKRKTRRKKKRRRRR